MNRHPLRPCQTTVSSYDFYFQADRPPQFQWFCEGCREVSSGFATSAAAEMDGNNHAGLNDVAEDPERIDWDALVLEAERLAAEGEDVPEWFTAGDLARYEGRLP